METDSRGGRRKARTRQALLDAARTLLATGASHDASIQDITDAADVGFGSFYNHFSDKSELFRAAIEQVLQQLGAALDESTRSMADPAERFVVCFRITGRLCLTRSEEAELIAQRGFELFDLPHGLGPRAQRDLREAVDSGRFRIAHVELAAAKTAGLLLALLQLALDPTTTVDAQDVDDCAEDLLRMFGFTPAAARKLANKPLDGSWKARGPSADRRL